MLAVGSLSVIGILIAGWASANKYSLMGGLRAAGQLIAYELPMVLAVVGVVIQAGTLNLQGIVAAQANGEIFGFGALGNPFILTQFVGLFVFLVAMQAELTQTPFDMPVAESEIVTGYMTEYSGIRFLLFFIGEFASAGAFAAVAATLFLGGWYLPGLDLDADYMNVVGPLDPVRQDDARRRSSSSGCGSPTRGSARTSCRASPGSPHPALAGEHPRHRILKVVVLMPPAPRSPA